MSYYYSSYYCLLFTKTVSLLFYEVSGLVLFCNRILLGYIQRDFGISIYMTRIYVLAARRGHENRERRRNLCHWDAALL